MQGLTPSQVHFGSAPRVLEQRQQVLHAAYDRHPERFVHGLPTVAELPAGVWINPPADRGATPVLQTPSPRTEDQLPSPNTH